MTRPPHRPSPRLSFEEAMLIWEARDVYRVKATLKGLVLVALALELVVFSAHDQEALGLVLVLAQWYAPRALRWLLRHLLRL